MRNYANEARMVIGDYVKPESTLVTLEEIHREFTGEEQSYSRWSQGQEFFMQVEWDESSFEEFLRVCKEKVEGDIEQISEAYLDVLEPDELSGDFIYESLQSNLADQEIGQKEGFETRKLEDGRVQATYYYYTTEVDISEQLEIIDIPNQKRIPLEFEPENRLIVVKTTRPARVQKAMSIINKYTEMKVGITGDLNSAPDDAEGIVRGFIESFPEERTGVESDE